MKGKARSWPWDQRVFYGFASDPARKYAEFQRLRLGGWAAGNVRSDRLQLLSADVDQSGRRRQPDEIEKNQPVLIRPDKLFCSSLSTATLVTNRQEDIEGQAQGSPI